MRGSSRNKTFSGLSLYLELYSVKDPSLWLVLLRRTRLRQSEAALAQWSGSWAACVQVMQGAEAVSSTQKHPGSWELTSLSWESWSGSLPTSHFLCPGALTPWTEGRVGSAYRQRTLRRPPLTWALLLLGPPRSEGGQPTSTFHLVAGNGYLSIKLWDVCPWDVVQVSLWGLKQNKTNSASLHLK